MPISKYNPDGTVDIYNTKTGEVRSGVVPQELGAISPKLVAEYQAGQAPGKILERKTAEAGLEELETGTVKDKSAEAARLEGIISSGTSSLSELRKIIDPKPEKVGLEGRGELFKAKLGFGLAVDELTNLSDVIGRLRSGAAINEAEEKRFKKLLPSPLKSEKRIRRDLERLRNELSFVAKAAGISVEGVGDQDAAQKAVQLDTRGGFEKAKDFFIGGALNIGQDIGTALSLKGKAGRGVEEAQATGLDLSRQAAQKALETEDPEARRRLSEVSQSTQAAIGRSAAEIEGGFSEDIEESIAGRATEFGLQSGTAVGIPSLVQSIVTGVGAKLSKKGVETATKEVSEEIVKNPQIKSKLIRVVDKIRSMSPVSKAGAKQAEAAAKSKAKPVVEKFIESGKKLAQADPDVAKEFIKQEPFIRKIKDIPALLDRMGVWGRSAFTRSGTTRATAKAELYKEFYKQGLEQLKTLAPEVYEQRQILRLTLELPRTLGKVLWRATLGKLLIK